MWEMIPNDFSVTLISEVGDRRLFAARRENIWHFVSSKPEASADPENGWFNWDIQQAHIPRYALADAVHRLRQFNALSREGFDPDDRVVTEESQRIGIYSRGPNSYDIDLLETESGWPQAVVELIDEDIDILESVRRNMETGTEEFVLSSATTPAGHPIASRLRPLIEAIAFEQAVLEALEAARVGVFGCYCVWRDLVVPEVLPRTFFEQLIENQFEYDANDYVDSPFLNLAMKVQSALLQRPIWGLRDGKAIALDPQVATDLLIEGMGKLSGYQITQFWLMDQLHSAGVFLSLAQVMELNSWDRYTLWKTQSFQPDSEEEQMLREEVAFIQMFGDLTAQQ